MALITCGVLVSDGESLLIGQATASPRWDIPKGVAEMGEGLLEAALRELREETGLAAEPASLVPLGVHRYLPGKQLALFAWNPGMMPDPAGLRCSSKFLDRSGRWLPEFARFAVLPWAEAVARVGKNMARVLGEVGRPGGLPLTRSAPPQASD